MIISTRLEKKDNLYATLIYKGHSNSLQTLAVHVEPYFDMTTTSNSLIRNIKVQTTKQIIQV